MVLVEGSTYSSLDSDEPRHLVKEGPEFRLLDLASPGGPRRLQL
jgi:hypothetical protein